MKKNQLFKRIRRTRVLGMARSPFALKQIDLHCLCFKGWGALMKHLNHCASYPVQLFLFLSICLFVLLRLATAIWLQIWVDDGDGLEEVRRANATWTDGFHTEEEFKGVINNNPNLEFYQLIYGLIIIAMLVFGFFKGAGILITMTRGSLKVISTMQDVFQVLWFAF